MPPRHSLVVRITHWTSAASFVALVVSGIAILLAHPRLYWGETGAFGAPSLIDLPLPTMLTGQSGWGRALHFQSAWAMVFTGTLYVVSGLLTRHFRDDLLPHRVDTGADAGGYNLLQRVTYLAVVFLLVPLMIWTGLAMSPAFTSVFPFTVDVLGGQQSARTIHFIAANVLVLFFVAHLVMVFVAGFLRHVGAMITGHLVADGKRA